MKDRTLSFSKTVEFCYLLLKSSIQFFIYNICDVFQRNESYVSELDFEKTSHKYATMNFDDFDFLSPKYIFFGNAYFSFILLFSTFYSLFRNTTYHFTYEFRKTEPINRTSSCRILWGFSQRMVDLFGTTGKPWMPSF